MKKYKQVHHCHDQGKNSSLFVFSVDRVMGKEAQVLIATLI